MEYETLIYEIRNNIAIITLNRPEAANSINVSMARDLMNCTLNCSENPGVRAVLITGIFTAIQCAVKIPVIRTNVLFGRRP